MEVDTTAALIIRTRMHVRSEGVTFKAIEKLLIDLRPSTHVPS